MEMLMKTRKNLQTKQILYIFILILILKKPLNWLTDYFKKLWFYRTIPHLPLIPFLGGLVRMRKDKTGLARDMIEFSTNFKNDPYFLGWVATHPFINIHKCDEIEQVFQNAEFSEKSMEYNLLHPWLNTGLLTSGGEKWINRRKLLTNAFHFDILKDFLTVMNEQTQIFISNLKNEPNKKNLKLLNHISTCTLDIICETAMGQNVSAQSGKKSAYTDAVHEISVLINKRFRAPQLWIDFIFNITQVGKAQAKCLNILHDFTRKIIKERDENFISIAETSKKRIAFLDLLLDAKRKNLDTITYDDIQEEVDTFMFEGHDTTSTSLNWTCFLIAKHPLVQKKLQEEIDSLFGNINRDLTTDDLNKLTYLECVIKESLRLFPSVPFIGRTIKEDTYFNGRKLFKGTSIMVYIYMIHRDERYFPNPEEFIPERFTPENSINRPSFAYIPFSAGRRNCIGQRFAIMELKVILANLIKNFEINCDQNLSDIDFCFELVTRPVNDILFSLTPRFQ